MFRNKTMLSVAAILAVGAVLTVVPATGFAGKIGGPMNVQGHASPDDYDTYTIRFEGGRPAHVMVKSFNRADLDIKVIDPVTLRVVAQDLRAAADAYVSFTPGRTREFIVIVHNFNRDRGTGYVLRTN